jgi:hypothetical protein
MTIAGAVGATAARGFGGFGWAVFGVVVGALLVLAAVASKMKGPRE